MIAEHLEDPMKQSGHIAARSKEDVGEVADCGLVELLSGLDSRSFCEEAAPAFAGLRRRRDLFAQDTFDLTNSVARNARRLIPRALRSQLCVCTFERCKVAAV